LLQRIFNQFSLLSRPVSLEAVDCRQTVRVLELQVIQRVAAPKAVDLFADFIGAGWSLGLDSAVNGRLGAPQS
jgi:hypothetical protein